jgi:hypothetical protein
VKGRSDPGLSAPPFELGGDDARIVEDEDVPGAQEIGQVGDPMIREGIRPDEEQSGRVARLSRPQRDSLGRELEVEQVDAHSAPRRAGRRRKVGG